jgi:hypothetical protein
MIETLVWHQDIGAISAPMILKDVPIDIYHGQCCAGPSVSSTNLRRIFEANGGSPAHCFSEWSGNPRKAESEDEEREHFVTGRAVHHLLLGQQAFSAHFAIRPEKRWTSWRTDDSKKWRAAQEAAGRSCLTETVVKDIIGMAKSLAADPTVRRGLLGGKIERSIFWFDKESGLWCKVRPDAIPTDSGDFADLKTTTSVQYGNLARAVREHAYHQQAALVFEAATLVLGIPAAAFSFTFCFVEKKPPYSVRQVALKAEDLALGVKLNRAARLRFASCLKQGRWPGPGDGHIVNIDLGDRYRGEAVSAADQIFRGGE